MAWKKPFFKRVSSKISARMLNLMTLSLGGEQSASVAGGGEGDNLTAHSLIRGKQKIEGKATTKARKHRESNT